MKRLPLNKLIDLSFEASAFGIRGHVLCKVVRHSGNSISLELWASDYTGWTDGPGGTIPERDALSWKPVGLKDLPLYVGFRKKWAIFDKELRAL